MEGSMYDPNAARTVRITIDVPYYNASKEQSETRVKELMRTAMRNLGVNGNVVSTQEQSQEPSIDGRLRDEGDVLSALTESSYPFQQEHPARVEAIGWAARNVAQRTLRLRDGREFLVQVTEVTRGKR